MTFSESGLRRTVCKALVSLHAIAVENSVLPGTPDVNFIEGWIELKCWGQWPKNPDTPLRIDHWTPQQRVWHIRRSRAGGRTYVLVYVERDIILLEGKVAARILGKAPRAALLEAAVAAWTGRAAMSAGLLDVLSPKKPNVDHVSPDAGP